MEALFLAFFVLIWVVTLIVRFFQWIGRQLGFLRTTLSLPPMQPAATRPAERPPERGLQPGRQPETGNPFGPEATTSGFRRQIEEMFETEPQAQGAPLAADSSRPAARPSALWNTDNDLLRAIVLQEALQPPLCRRPRRTARAADVPPDITPS